MRLVLAMVLAGLALPLSVSAQAGEEGEAVETSADEPVPSPEPASEESDLSLRLRKRTRQQWDPGTYDLSSDEPAPEEPALQLELDAAGVEVVPTPPRTADGYTLEEMELRVWRTKIGLGVSAGAMVLGTVLLLVGTLADDCWEWDAPTKCDVLPIVGGTLMVGGLVGVVASSVRNAKVQGKKVIDPWWRRGEHYRKPRRVQWDLETSRVVF